MSRSSASIRPRTSRTPLQRRWIAPVFAFLATMMALPGAASITIPDQPLTLGARIPPNILFILDNSGSMGWDYMPDSVPNVATYNIRNQTYARNTIYYNPFVTYQPWVDPTGATMTGGTDYTAAYSHNDLVPPFDSNTVNLSNQVQTYYVPKNPADPATFGDIEGYYRYQILTNGDVERSEWDATNPAPGFPVTGLSGASNSFQVLSQTITVPANAVRITITATNASAANLNWRRNQAPVATTTPRVNNTTATKTLAITAAADLAEGNIIYIGLQGRTPSGFSDVTVTVTFQLSDSGCSGTGWTNCVTTTPTGRTAAQERENFATWYSYHRTRMKVAKSAAGRAFAELGPAYRVGYRNIYNNMPNNNTTIPGGGVWPVGGRWNTHPITRAKPIPIARNAGLFDDPNGTTGTNNNKTAWYQRLYAQTNSGSTPLRLALWEAGEYFKNADEDGPWGPGTGNDQYACRQSFTILNTDGYRNDATAALWNGQIGEEDNVAGTTITGPGGTYTYTPVRPYRSEHSGNLADIAMHYWKNDLRPDLRNVVPSSDSNPAFWQHMVTFSVSLGATGNLNPETDLPALTSGSLSWPFPENLHPTSIDDLWHATVNGRGEFIVANDGDAFVRGLRNTLNAISNRLGSFSNVAANSVSLDTGTRVFSASYRSGEWSGQLTARAVTSSGVSDVIWTASLPGWSTRKVFTSDGTAGQDFPTSAQLAILARGGAPTNFPVTGAKNADYIKGDDSEEVRRGNGGLLRDRTTPLGDIIGSSPAYVADTKTLYVGANDGMLHAFDATNGNELFAYIPSIIDWGNLSTLSRGDYAHRYFVDGPVAVTTRAMTPSKNILVGSLGRGGKGLFALDVSNPAEAAADSVFKWERTETPGAHMGLVLGKPLLSGLANGKVGAVVANGINSASNRAALLVLDVETGAVIREIDTGAGSALLPNGLSAPTGVYGVDGKTLAYVYAGDLLGNVWKFDLRDASPSAWSVQRLFTAGDGEGSQPISAAVSVATHPRTYRRWVFFGTGRYLTAEDADPLLSSTVQSMYGFIENTSAALDRDDLTQRTFQVVTGTVDTIPVRAFEARAPLPPGSQGWYVDLPGDAERIVQDPQVVSGFLITASMTPTGDACEPDGSGFINAVDAFTGTSPGASFFDLDGDGSTTDSVVDSDGVSIPVGSINVGVGMPTLPNVMRGRLLVSGTNANLGSPAILTPRWDRVSWREIRRD